jgi:hypothetical protein
MRRSVNMKSAWIKLCSTESDKTSEEGRRNLQKLQLILGILASNLEGAVECPSQVFDLEMKILQINSDLRCPLLTRPPWMQHMQRRKPSPKVDFGTRLDRIASTAQTVSVWDVSVRAVDSILPKTNLVMNAHVVDTKPPPILLSVLSIGVTCGLAELVLSGRNLPKIHHLGEPLLPPQAIQDELIMFKMTTVLSD